MDLESVPTGERAIGRSRETAPRAPRLAENIVTALLKQAGNAQPAALAKQAGAWRELRWDEIVDRVRRLSEGLVALGVEPGDRVCICAPTRLEWCLVDFAILGAGAVTVPIYPSSTAAEIEYVVRDSGARMLVLDGDTPEGGEAGRWTRVRQVRGKLPGLDQVVALDLPGNKGEALLSLADVEARGAERLQKSPHALERRAARIGADDLATIVYTSGTTGQPKGVMLTHASWAWQAGGMDEMDVVRRDDTLLLFLPLAHVFGRAISYAWLAAGCRLAFAESVEKLVDNAAQVGATVLPAVPRVFEKAYAKVIHDGTTRKGLGGVLFRRALKLFDRYAEARAQGRSWTSPEWEVLRRVVFGAVERKLKARFGGRMRLFISAGAPLPLRVAVLFELCGLVVVEAYGLTETTAPTHVNRVGRRRLGTVGQPVPGAEVRLADDGEVLVRGPMVMKGYHGLPEQTAEVIDPNGWFHTGDIGEIDAEGYLRITDRKKDLIKTATGKYVAPQLLESALKAEPLVSQVVVLGDRRPYVTALVTLSDENLQRWAAGQGLGPEGLAQRPEVRARLQAAVDALNETLPAYSRIRKFEVLEREFSLESGELTAKLSIRRKVVAEKFKDRIDRMYGGAETA